MSTNVIPFPARHDATTAGTPDATHQGASVTPAHGQVASITTAVYTVAEVATLLSLSTGSTYQLVRTGQIPAKKMGGRWVIPKRRFHAWLDDLPEASAEDIERELRHLDRSS